MTPWVSLLTGTALVLTLSTVFVIVIGTAIRRMSEREMRRENDRSNFLPSSVQRVYTCFIIATSEKEMEWAGRVARESVARRGRKIT